MNDPKKTSEFSAAPQASTIPLYAASSERVHMGRG